MYYIRANQLTGELLQVSYEYLIQNEGEIIKIREGEMPDLNKFEWHPSLLSFVEKPNQRLMTQEMFTRRMTQDELRTIYTLAKSSIDVEIWLDRFKMSKEIDLDDPVLKAGLQGLEAMGAIAPGRVDEIFS